MPKVAKKVNNRWTITNYPLNFIDDIRKMISPALCKTPARKAQTLVCGEEKSVAPEDSYVDVCKNAHLWYIAETGAKTCFPYFFFPTY